MRRATRSPCSLDGDESAVAGDSFEVAVRAAGSILQAHHRRGRRCALVVNSAARETQRGLATDANWRRALEMLAATEPTARTPAFALLQADGGIAARSLELVVVTSRVDVAARRPARAAGALAARRLARLRPDDARAASRSSLRLRPWDPGRGGAQRRRPRGGARARRRRALRRTFLVAVVPGGRDRGDVAAAREPASTTRPARSQ